MTVSLQELQVLVAVVLVLCFANQNYLWHRASQDARMVVAQRLVLAFFFLVPWTPTHQTLTALTDALALTVDLQI
jgi:hypothetical protein